MTDYCDNVVKVFVPTTLAHLIPQVIAQLAEPGATAEKPSVWMSFQRLLPRPAIYDENGPLPIDVAIRAHAGKRHESVVWGYPPPSDAASIMAHLRSISPQHAQALEVVGARMERYGVPTAYEWQVTRWGTKWDAMEGDPPDVRAVSEVNGSNELAEYEDCMMIDYRFTTAYSPPIGYLEALARLCSSSGLGMKAWFSGSDDHHLNPWTNEIENSWTEVENVAVPVEETSDSRRLELSGGIEICPDDAAERRIEQRDRAFAMLI